MDEHETTSQKVDQDIAPSYPDFERDEVTGSTLFANGKALFEQLKTEQTITGQAFREVSEELGPYECALPEVSYSTDAIEKTSIAQISSTPRILVGEEIAEQDFYSIRKAFDTRTNRLVLVKMLRIKYSKMLPMPTRPRVEALQREAAITAKSESPYVVEVMDFVPFYTQEGLLSAAIVMRYLREDLESPENSYRNGKKILERIKGADGQAPEFIGQEVYLRLLINIAQAMAELRHQHQIRHNDWSMGNLMVNTLGQIKVIDFNIAEQDEETIKSYIVTRRYSSETQRYNDAGYITANKQTTEEDDVEVLAILAFEFLTGESPYTKDSLKILKRKPRLAPAILETLTSNPAFTELYPQFDPQAFIAAVEKATAHQYPENPKQSFLNDVALALGAEANQVELGPIGRIA